MRKNPLHVLLSVLTAAVIMSLCALSVSAESIADSAKPIKSGKTYSATLENGKHIDYKITVTKSGNLNINVNSKMYCTAIYLYDSNGNKIDYSDVSSTSGELSSLSIYKCPAMLYWNDKIEEYRGVVTFPVKKGVYYIRCERTTEYYHTYASGKISIKAEYPDSSDDESNAKIDCLTLTLKKDESVQLGALISGTTDEAVKWKSSDKTIAAVSSDGKITAKSNGSAYITATLGKSSIKIKIKVQ